VQGKINGAPISRRHALGMSVLAMFAGLDTVVAMLGHVMRFLAMNPGHRQQILDDPGITNDAVEELLRRFAVVTDAREVNKDLDWKGIRFRKDDMILLPTMLHSLDERRFADPLTVDFQRQDKLHLAFGAGVHRCIGSMLARTELRVLLQEWLPRIPEFGIKSGARVPTQSGQVSVIMELPLEWAPRQQAALKDKH
jgi:cytochrome P450